MVKANKPCKFSGPDWASLPCRCSGKTNRMRFQVLFLELGPEEASYRDVYSGTTGDCDEKSLCLRVRRGLYLITIGQCQQGCCISLLTAAVSPASFLFSNQGFKEVLL